MVAQAKTSVAEYKLDMSVINFESVRNEAKQCP
jgi:hypothetical protein